ncbi:sulfurtransferase TusA family protein [Sphingomonas profundi]|uniref:sulfurtransferase TusA family protein n=1 Tax=Alterirhizorhabdus profundi TaxID=2681549 RepID=UPI0012E7928C|nr:sulfurtransferase TusA family protein [Sphingomonas profundi]
MAAIVDARGLRCPWPALRLARAMRGLAAGAGVRLIADDPAAAAEVAAMAAERGWTVATPAPDTFDVTVRIVP